jgi:hypothetical protein
MLRSRFGNVADEAAEALPCVGMQFYVFDLMSLCHGTAASFVLPQKENRHLGFA